MTGYLPSATGRNTSARSTTPSSMAIGASQSIRILFANFAFQHLKHSSGTREAIKAMKIDFHRLSGSE